jgi:hypothetical protein
MSLIDRRASKRIPVCIEAKLVIDSVIYAAFIRDVSETGVNTIITPITTPIEISSHSPLELKFQIPSAKNLHLYCTKKWSQTVSNYGLTKKIGMQIISPPSHYKEYLSYLKMQQRDYRSTFSL